MRVALINPAWHFEQSIYFGCRDAHLPLELGAARVLLARAGHDVLLADGLIEERDAAGLADGWRRSVRTCPWSRRRRPICSGAARRRNCVCRAR